MKKHHLAALFGVVVPLWLGPAGAPARATPVSGSATAHAALTPVEKGWVLRVQDRMNAITTLKARFRQKAPDGKTTTGVVWLERPGRVRFEYDKPSPLLLVANRGQVVFRDSQLKQTTTIPLDKTPLGLLLRSHLAFNGDVTITGFEHSQGQIRISVVRTASPGDGSLTLIFSESPLSLQSWVVKDAQGRMTQVSLSDIQPGVRVPPALFDIPEGEGG